MVRFVLLVIAILAFSVAVNATDNTGFREIQLPGGVTNRPLHVSLWYPTVQSQSVETVG